MGPKITEKVKMNAMTEATESEFAEILNFIFTDDEILTKVSKKSQ